MVKCFTCLRKKCSKDEKQFCKTTGYSHFIRKKRPMVRTGYYVTFSGKYKDLDCEKEFFVDDQNKDDVHYLFHVHLCDPDAKVYVCFNDGTKRRIYLGRRKH